ncbi:MAG: hypothetical protein AUJ92_15830 [Armatimonadetes bacterium CG2_30_59_28]|nr:hypothetical protein [Armatimonadota bacterium]OIO91804.1 MAG: hypothetical protein AUJ92_15830 [Armatimonadetes bacterium CG2_30_59_28]PIU66639.1 MAG: hypothetical protein COS85_04115 [Armatimonadetes bacterium CG07_land_8_20_14_0_80_59_28]PIX40654.1 MAG: hypothetical protein COZ56_14215 [Armatimonadetes bacterium CG_4_8_14_3_um_filter_58_9]PIY38193.1 MAG: hypothetical protein COZ05_21185 [Armatimonadetes bacterium CG_4_10_14_3_um_filter_59_10]PJB71896.1 MAG: hypothetical protein CO095_075
MGFAVTCRWLTIFSVVTVFSLSPLLPRPPALLLARSHASVGPADLDSLKQHLAKDLATAFQQSRNLFQEPKG